jgi:hypothetical protein
VRVTYNSCLINGTTSREYRYSTGGGEGVTLPPRLLHDRGKIPLTICNLSTICPVTCDLAACENARCMARRVILVKRGRERARDCKFQQHEANLRETGGN